MKEMSWPYSSLVGGKRMGDLNEGNVEGTGGTRVFVSMVCVERGKWFA